ncbi:hypothetical protein OPIT5_18615 [Opitutaceae bacterium TAV5]|nr:hypothetical protein OPIT5_18615 [Opitutaceae bacterium TAV5]
MKTSVSSVRRMRASACCLLLAGLLPAASALHAQTRDYSVTFTTPRTLATNTASWNYTLDQAYPSGDPGSTPAGMFIARGQSSDSDHSITVIGGVTAYEIHTVGLQTADFGFYLMNLDFTSLVPDESITVTWSFKILANDTDDRINPDNWSVKFATSATSAGNASFPEVASIFSFNDDGSTWTTVTGQFVLPANTSLTRGGILINGLGSGSIFSTPDSVYLADLVVTITSNSTIPEPSAWPLLGGLAASGAAGLLLRKRRR